jgi:hypothetical protein
MIIVKTFFGFDFTPKMNGKDLALEIARVTSDLIEHTFSLFYFFKGNLLGSYADFWLFRNSKERDIINRID